MRTHVARRLRSTKSPVRMVRLSPETSKWMEKVATKRKLNLNALTAIVVDAFKKLPADQQERAFSGEEAKS